MLTGNIAQNKAAVMWPPIVDKSMQVIQIKSHEKVKIKRFWTFTSGWVEQKLKTHSLVIADASK